jgi:hypothetical protein
MIWLEVSNEIRATRQHLFVTDARPNDTDRSPSGGDAPETAGRTATKASFSCNESCPSDRASTIGSAFAPNDQPSSAASAHR